LQITGRAEDAGKIIRVHAEAGRDFLRDQGETARAARTRDIFSLAEREAALRQRGQAKDYQQEIFVHRVMGEILPTKGCPRQAAN
jgi:hypothetical protein